MKCPKCNGKVTDWGLATVTLGASLFMDDDICERCVGRGYITTDAEALSAMADFIRVLKK